jgi:hypothetical protein
MSKFGLNVIPDFAHVPVRLTVLFVAVKDPDTEPTFVTELEAVRLELTPAAEPPLSKEIRTPEICNRHGVPGVVRRCGKQKFDAELHWLAVEIIRHDPGAGPFIQAKHFVFGVLDGQKLRISIAVGCKSVLTPWHCQLLLSVLRNTIARSEKLVISDDCGELLQGRVLTKTDGIKAHDRDA